MIYIENITERDIFYYVFFKSLLSPSQINYIKCNPCFKNEIKFYKNLKKALELGISENAKKKISAIIEYYKI